jgi:hypothetical protein
MAALVSSRGRSATEPWVRAEIAGAAYEPVVGVGVLTLGTARLEHVEVVSAAGVVPGAVVHVSPSGAAADENEVEMLDLRVMAAVAGSGEITVTAVFDVPTVGPVPFVWSAH